MDQAVKPASPEIAVNSERLPVVFERDGEVFANSRDVAAFFAKRHDHVLEAIDNLLKSLAPEKSGAETRMFALTSFADPSQPGREFRSFDMTRDGFALLAFSFTGERALKWKLKYIEAFNVMEAELRARPPFDPHALLSDAAAVRGLLLTYVDKVIALQADVAALAPKAEALARLAEAKGSLPVAEAAKALQVGRAALWARLAALGWTYRLDGRPAARQEAIDAELLEHKATTIHFDGAPHVVTQVRIRAKGLALLAREFPRPGVAAAARAARQENARGR